MPYGDHRPEFGGGNGKNAIPGVCFNILGDRAKSEYFARLVTGSYEGRTRGHTGGFMGFVWGNFHGARDPHYPDYRRMLDHWGWLMNVSRRWDGGFLLPESIIGHIYTYRGPVLATGGMAQLYAMPGANLRIHGGPRSVFAAQKLPANIAKGVELYRDRKFDNLRKTVKSDSDLARQLLAAADRKEKDIELTLAKIEAAIAGNNLASASQMTTDLARFAGGGRDLRLGAFRWQIRTHKNAGPLARARGLYERYKWLTYTHPKAREVFEKLAADPSAGPYQRLARNELATSPDASRWTFYSELLYKEYVGTWRIDELARASMLRVSGIRSGNWTQIAALNTLYQAGVLTELLDKNWTPLAAACSKGYPGKKPTWRLLGVPRGEAPPKGWTEANFDDSKWTAGAGPIAGRGEGLQVAPRSAPYLRIVFNCDRTDYKSVVLTLRLLKNSRAVAFLNGAPILWSNATQGPRMRMNALVTIDLPPATIKRLGKGRNVLAVRLSSGNGADFGLYANTRGDTLGFEPRDDGWAIVTKLAAPDLSTKTPGRPRLTTVLPAMTTGLIMDPPGKPNDPIGPLRADFSGKKGSEAPRKTPLAERAKYLGHYDSRLRRDAAYSMMPDGEKAMPYILKALDSNDIRVIRSGCDALGGRYAMNGRGRPNWPEGMTTEIAGQAVPKLLPLLKHEDAYIREGALMALANCGKAAAQHLDEVLALAHDEEWWVRAGVSHVLGYVQEPETDGKAGELIEAFHKETSVCGRNRLRESLVNMARRGHNTDAAVKALLAEASSTYGLRGSRGFAEAALGKIGPNAKAAAPLFEAKLAEAKKKLAAAKTSADKKRAERRIKSLQRTINTMTSSPKPPKPPRNRKKKKKK